MSFDFFLKGNNAKKIAFLADYEKMCRKYNLQIGGKEPFVTTTYDVKIEDHINILKRAARLR